MNAVRTYNLWSDTYPPIAHNPVMRAEQVIVEAMLRRLRPRRALDVGTGSGRYVPILKATGASVTGVDFSWGMLSKGRGRRVCGDARQLPFRSGSFDLANASLMVGDIADLAPWAVEIARVLEAGGHLVYSDFHPTWAEHGWRRTFTAADGATHEMAIETHTIEQHLDALEGAGFRVQSMRAPRLYAERSPAVAAFRREWGDPPVVVVLHAVKQP